MPDPGDFAKNVLELCRQEILRFAALLEQEAISRSSIQAAIMHASIGFERGDDHADPA